MKFIDRIRSRDMHVIGLNDEIANTRHRLRQTTAQSDKSKLALSYGIINALCSSERDIQIELMTH